MPLNSARVSRHHVQERQDQKNNDNQKNPRRPGVSKPHFSQRSLIKELCVHLVLLLRFKLIKLLMLIHAPTRLLSRRSLTPNLPDPRTAQPLLAIFLSSQMSPSGREPAWPFLGSPPEESDFEPPPPVQQRSSIVPGPSWVSSRRSPALISW